MSRKDKDMINFSEDHELNHILETVKKKASIVNRKMLQELGRDCKKSLGRQTSQTLAHQEFYDYLAQSGSLGRLE